MKYILKLLLLCDLAFISLTTENANNDSYEDVDITEDLTNKTSIRSSNFTINFSSEDYSENVITDSDKSNSSKKGHKTLGGYEETHGIQRRRRSLGSKKRQTMVEIMKKHKRNITYSVLTLSNEWLSRKSVRKAIRHALDLWSEVIELDFYEVSNTSLRALIQFEYGVNFTDPSYGLNDEHYGFCKPNVKILQNFSYHSYPAVQILFNSNVKWAYLDAQQLTKTTGNKILSYNSETKQDNYIDTYEYQDILWVALHQIGHAIGIDHFNPRQPHAIMNQDYIMPLMSNSTGRPISYPYVVPRLSLADIGAARNHYRPRIHFNCVRAGICEDLHATNREIEEEPSKKDDRVSSNNSTSLNPLGKSDIEAQQTANELMQDGCRAFIKEMIGDENFEELKKLRESGTSNEMIKKKIVEFLDSLTDKDKKQKASKYAPICQKIFDLDA